MDRVSLYWKNATAEAVGEKHGVNEKELKALAPRIKTLTRQMADERKAGWWDPMIGPGRPVDTDKYFVVCANVLGSCMGSSGPASIARPETSRAARSSR